MQGSSTRFDCTPVDVESKIQGLRTECVIDCTHVAAEESKIASTVLFRASKELELGKVRLLPADTPSSKRRKPMTDEEELESWQHLCLLYYQAAIAYYNASNPGAEIELVEGGRHKKLFHELVMWYHFNFKARPKNSDSPDLSPKLYFAEIRAGENGHHFTTVCVVDPLDSGSTTIIGCIYCRSDSVECPIYHPKDGKWTAGRVSQPLSREFEHNRKFERRELRSKEFECGKLRPLFPADSPCYSDRIKLMTQLKKSFLDKGLLYYQVAIAYYNANNLGAEIELVEAGHPRVVIHKFMVWYHFNFKARPKNSDSPDPSPRLYFTEILPRGKENHVTTVCVVDPLDSESTINGCTSCLPHPIKYRIYHPKDDKWTAGRPTQLLGLPDYALIGA